MNRPFLAAVCIATLLAADSPLCAQSSLAQNSRVRQAVSLVEVWLDAQQAFDQIPGLSAAVVHDQEIVWSGAFGYANREDQLPATTGTLYSICSISKLFTSIGVMQLRDEGLLRLDDPVHSHLPWFSIRSSDTLGPVITVAGLLTHSAGLPRESDHAYWTGPNFVFPTREDIISRLPGQEVLYPAETYFQYSNLGLSLAGALIEARSGRSYDAYVQERILGPLNLSRTYPAVPRDEHGRGLAIGYSALQRDGQREPVALFDARGIGPAAGYASNVEDIARFASWQFRVLDRAGGEDVLSANTLRQMHRVHWVDPDFETLWGLGFSVSRSDEKTFVGHGGSCPGYRSQLLMRPEQKIATVFMANAQSVNAGGYARQIYEIMSPVIGAAVRDTAHHESAGSDFEAYTGVYTTDFAGEIAIVAWEDGLAAVGLPTMNPVQGLTKLKAEGDHTFRRVRKDDALGESVVFEIGEDGRAARFFRHSNVFRRVK